MSDLKEGLSLLREPFPPHQIGKLPKPTKQQTEEVKKDFTKGIRCTECGQWHHPKVVHLDYVGHAPLTDRFLNADPNWFWEPMALDDKGLPAFDNTGGLWIKLSICGVTRIGYGNAPAKGEAGNREKEVIGDALRNAGMRFGCALDLWHKGELHIDNGEVPEQKPTNTTDPKEIILKRCANANSNEEWTKIKDQLILEGFLKTKAEKDFIGSLYQAWELKLKKAA